MGKPLSPQELRTGLVALNVIILLTALAAIGFDLYVTALVSTLDFGWWIQNIVFGTSVSGVLMGIFALCGSSMALSANSRNRPTEWRSACWLNGTAFVWCLIHFGLWVTCLVFGILDIGMYTIGAAMLILLIASVSWSGQHYRAIYDELSRSSVEVSDVQMSPVNNKV